MIRKNYQYFFENEQLKSIATRKEAPNDVVQQMLFFADVGNECIKTFVEKCLVKQAVSVFDKRTKYKLKTGIKKPHKTSKSVEALTEDVQGFAILAEKNVPLNDGFKSPVTKLPSRILNLSIAESKTSLRRTSNASKFRICKSTLNKVNAYMYLCPKPVVWVYVTGKFVRSMVPKSM